jgi:antitoxin MazE
MILRLMKCDDGVALRLPMEVAAQIHANEGAQVDLTIESGKVVLTPIESGLRTYTLDELLAGITEENLHGETLRSAPVGNEIV